MASSYTFSKSCRLMQFLGLFFGVVRYLQLALPLHIHVFHVCLCHSRDLFISTLILWSQTAVLLTLCTHPRRTTNHRSLPESFVVLWGLPSHRLCQLTGLCAVLLSDSLTRVSQGYRSSRSVSKVFADWWDDELYFSQYVNLLSDCTAAKSS